jgi:hypothetical protein
MAIENPGTQLSLPLPDVRPVSQRPATFLSNVDTLLSALWGVKEFKQYLDHLTNAKSITGKFDIDRGFAARRIQEEAAKAKMLDVASAKITKIMRAIETLLRRDDMGRKQRLRQIAAAATQAAQAAE